MSAMQVYVQRLGCDLLNAVAVRRAAGISFNLAMELLGELPALQFPPSLLAAAILYAARKAQVQPSRNHNLVHVGRCREHTSC